MFLSCAPNTRSNLSAERRRRNSLSFSSTLTAVWAREVVASGRYSLLLADTLLIMTNRPGRVAKTMDIALPRPRELTRLYAARVRGDVRIEDRSASYALIAVQGPKGKIETYIPSGIKLEQKDGQLVAVEVPDSCLAAEAAADDDLAGAVVRALEQQDVVARSGGEDGGHRAGRARADDHHRMVRSGHATNVGVARPVE